MTTSSSPRAIGRHDAVHAPPRPTVGAPKDAARQGVRSPLGSGSRPATITGVRAGLTVRGLGRETAPVADWLCVCGHHERARGRTAITALTTRVRAGTCPHRTAENAEGRTAA